MVFGPGPGRSTPGMGNWLRNGVSLGLDWAAARRAILDIKRPAPVVPRNFRLFIVFSFHSHTTPVRAMLCCALALKRTHHPPRCGVVVSRYRRHTRPLQQE